MNAPTTNTDLRKFAKKGIDRANDTTLKMIVALLNVHDKEAEEEEAYEKEMLRRFDDFEKGKSKTFTFDELVANARDSFAEYQKAAK